MAGGWPCECNGCRAYGLICVSYVYGILSTSALAQVCLPNDWLAPPPEARGEGSSVASPRDACLRE